MWMKAAARIEQQVASPGSTLTSLHISRANQIKLNKLTLKGLNNESSIVWKGDNCNNGGHIKLRKINRKSASILTS